MTRDYKSPRGGRSGSLSGTAGLVVGLALGLLVALAVYIYDRRPSAQAEKPVPARNAPRASAEEETPEEQSKYSFYEMLPKFEVVVPEREQVKARGAPPEQIKEPGAYVLQAGSYRNYADADRVRAQLALQGIESQVQRVQIDKDAWHRVRIGPIADLAELNRVREKLKRAEVEAIVLRVGD